MTKPLTSPAHTPGPWAFDPRHLVVFDVAVKLGVASIELATTTRDEALANGWLITAAPELLDVVKLVERTCQGWLSSLLENESFWCRKDDWQHLVEHFTSIVNQCRSAIASTEGR